jgi:hypothetical protein
VCIYIYICIMLFLYTYHTYYIYTCYTYDLHDILLFTYTHMNICTYICIHISLYALGCTSTLDCNEKHKLDANLPPQGTAAGRNREMPAENAWGHGRNPWGRNFVDHLKNWDMFLNGVEFSLLASKCRFQCLPLIKFMKRTFGQ